MECCADLRFLVVVVTETAQIAVPASKDVECIAENNRPGPACSRSPGGNADSLRPCSQGLTGVEFTAYARRDTSFAMAQTFVRSTS